MENNQTNSAAIEEAKALVSLLDSSKKFRWLEENFPLLTTNGFRAALAKQYQERSADSPEPWFEYKEIRWAVVVQARIQMEKLALKALEVLAGTEHARAAMAPFLLAEGPELPDELRSYCQERVALTILELAPRVLPDNLRAALILGLTKCPDMPETARNILLEALQILIDKWRRFGPPASVGSISKLMLDALELELLRPSYLQSEKFLVALLKLISRHPDNMFVPVLKLIASSNRCANAQDLARTALQTIATSLEMRWQNTRTDELSDRVSQAQRIAALHKEQPDADVCIQTIFNNTKGRPIESAFDPRAAELKILLGHSDMSVRVAACWALYDQGNFCPHLDDFTGGIATLANVAVNSTCPGLTRDAIELSLRLHEDFPEARERIEKANEEASKTFVEQQLIASQTMSGNDINNTIA